MLAMVTCQRRSVVVAARRQDFIPSGTDGGLWMIEGFLMKSNRPHAVPLPPLAWDVVQEALAVAPERQPLLFPQMRLRRSSDQGDQPMSANLLNDLLKQISSPVTTHDFRRAFATHGEELLGFTRTESKIILDHAEGQGGDVTGLHYALHDRRHVKWTIMERWCRFLAECIDKAAPIEQAAVAAA
jgi:integrase